MQKNAILNCYSDLYRSAYSLAVNPRGQNHLIFLNHAIKNLKILKYKKTLVKIQKKLSKQLSPKEISYLADQILTTGILLKQNSPLISPY